MKKREEVQLNITIERWIKDIEPRRLHFNYINYAKKSKNSKEYVNISMKLMIDHFKEM